MSTVIVVGAGATYADAVAQNACVLPPLDGTFFQVCGKCREARRLRGKDWDPFYSYVRERYGIDPVRGGWGMEEVFNLVYSDAFPVQDDEGPLDAYWRLVRAYYGVISLTTNGLQPTASGVRGLLEALLANKAAGQIRFVTFNHDIVIEKSLQETVSGARFRSEVLKKEELHELYRIEAAVDGFRGKRRPLLRACLAYAPILKLHGSLNWVRHVDDRRSWRSVLPAPEERIICVDHRKIRTGPGAHGHDVVPVIVPPIMEKSQQYTKVLGPIWDEAEKLLRNATRVIVFGYSLPDADPKGRSLLRASLGTSTCLTEVVVINPDPAVVGKVAHVLSGARMRQYPGVTEFRASLGVE